MLKHIYEHLKTKRKYNTLMIMYETKKDELEQKIVKLNTQKRINKIEHEKFEQTIEEHIQKLVKEKQKFRELKEKIKHESRIN